MALPVPPQFLPMFVVGGFMLSRLRRNHHRGDTPLHAYKPYRGPARVSHTASYARPSSPGGMDGERIHPRKHGRRAFKR